LLTPAWPGEPPPGVGAAMSTRAGGVSKAPWQSLNLGVAVGDEADAVATNRRRFGAALGARPVWLRQVHGVAVLRLDAGTPQHPAEPADAAWTTEPGIACTVQVADCLPVLLAARDGRAVAAAHAGWRGLAAGVLERTVEALGTPPVQLRAWIGPAIGAARFEVGAEVREALLSGAWQGDPAAAACFSANPAGRWQCDLAGLARLRLGRLGIGSVAGGGWCTATAADRFFSHRRDGRTGRMAALLWRESPGSGPAAC
jgi:YfiH family protein